MYFKVCINNKCIYYIKNNNKSSNNKDSKNKVNE